MVQVVRSKLLLWWDIMAVVGAVMGCGSVAVLCAAVAARVLGLVNFLRPEYLAYIVIVYVVGFSGVFLLPFAVLRHDAALRDVEAAEAIREFGEPALRNIEETLRRVAARLRDRRWSVMTDHSFAMALSTRMRRAVRDGEVVLPDLSELAARVAAVPYGPYDSGGAGCWTVMGPYSRSCIREMKKPGCHKVVAVPLGPAAGRDVVLACHAYRPTDPSTGPQCHWYVTASDALTVFPGPCNVVVLEMRLPDGLRYVGQGVYDLCGFELEL